MSTFASPCLQTSRTLLPAVITAAYACWLVGHLPRKVEAQSYEQVEELSGYRAGAGHHTETERRQTRIVVEVAERVADCKHGRAEHGRVDLKGD